jgi:F0F1-type ATP synthase assembly protein I
VSAPLKPTEETFVQAMAAYGFVLGQFLGGTGAGIGIGWYLWTKRGLPWWTLLITTALGILVASIQVIRYQRRLDASTTGKRVD